MRVGPPTSPHTPCDQEEKYCRWSNIFQEAIPTQAHAASVRAFASSITAEAAKNTPGCNKSPLLAPLSAGKGDLLPGQLPRHTLRARDSAAPDGIFFIICAGLASITLSFIFWDCSVACAWISQGSISAHTRGWLRALVLTMTPAVGWGFFFSQVPALGGS